MEVISGVQGEHHSSCWVQRKCTYHSSLRISLIGLMRIVNAVVNSNILFLISCATENWGNGVSYRNKTARSRYLIDSVIEAISKVNSMQNSRNILSYFVKYNSKLIVMRAFCCNENVFGLEVWVEHWLDPFHCKENSIIWKMKIVLH